MALMTPHGATAEKIHVSELARWAASVIPFYRDHLADVRTYDLQSLPSFDKHATAGYGSFPLTAGGPAGAQRVFATSGTTGDRLYVAFERSDHERVGNWLEAVGERAGLASADVLLNTHCYGLWVGGPVLDLLAYRAGACVVPLGPGSPSGVLHMLNSGVGTAISATPSYFRRLIEVAEATSFDLTATGLRLGFVGAELAEPSLRRKLLSRMPKGFRWVELYGLTETFGPSVAFGPDPGIAELELNIGDFHVEVLGFDADRPVPAGEVGELTLTSRRFSRTPLIRYRTKDLARVTAGSADAPTKISRILGRADDALKIGGVLMYPTAVAEIVTGLLPPSAEWLGTVRRHGHDDELVLEVEADEELCEAVEVAFAERVGLEVTVIAAEAAALARSHEKTRRILIEVADPAAPRPGRRSSCG